MNTVCVFGHEETDQDPAYDVYYPYEQQYRYTNEVGAAKDVHCKRCYTWIGTYYAVDPPKDRHMGLVMQRGNLFDNTQMFRGGCWCGWVGYWYKRDWQAAEDLDTHIHRPPSFNGQDKALLKP